MAGADWCAVAVGADKVLPKVPDLHLELDKCSGSFRLHACGEFKFVSFRWEEVDHRSLHSSPPGIIPPLHPLDPQPTSLT